MNQKKIKVGTEEIQAEAIKCKHCNEFLAALPQKSKAPWYAKPVTLVISFLTVGPLALPLVWLNPAYSRRKKILVTVIMLVLTCGLIVVFLRAAKPILEYYKQVGIF